MRFIVAMRENLAKGKQIEHGHGRWGLSRLERWGQTDQEVKRSRGQESTEPKCLSYRKEKLKEGKQKPRPWEEEEV